MALPYQQLSYQLESGFIGIRLSQGRPHILITLFLQLLSDQGLEVHQIGKVLSAQEEVISGMVERLRKGILEHVDVLVVVAMGVVVPHEEMVLILDVGMLLSQDPQLLDQQML